MEYRLYTEKELLDFGKYLLSKDRSNNVKNRLKKDKVSYSDLKNWEDMKINKLIERLDTPKKDKNIFEKFIGILKFK
jgi:hypothetical protein